MASLPRNTRNAVSENRLEVIAALAPAAYVPTPDGAYADATGCTRTIFGDITLANTVGSRIPGSGLVRTSCSGNDESQ